MITPAPPRSRPPLTPKPPGAPNQPTEMIQNRLTTFSRLLPLSTSTNYAPLRERSLTAIRACVADNYSNQWVWLRDANMFVPPMTDCKVIILRGITEIWADWLTPNGITGNAEVTGAGCYLFFTEEELSPNPGRDISHWLPV